MLKQWRYALLVAVAVAISIFVAACGSDSGSANATPGATSAATATPAVACVDGNITASGSTALGPLITKIASIYSGHCSGSTVTVQGGGSGTGRSQVEAGSVAIGLSDTPSGTGQEDLKDHQVTVVIFGVIVNPDTGVTNLTTDQLKGIYAGTITNWKDAGGKDEPITVVSRPATSGTRATFAQYVLGTTEKVTGPDHLTSDATGTVVTEIAGTSGAIGYAALGQVPTDGSVKSVSIDGKAPNADNVKTNAYKFWNIEHMYTKGEASGLAKAIIDFVNSPEGQAEQAKEQFVPLANVDKTSIDAHNATPKPAA